MTTFGVGFNEENNSFLCGHKAAKKALSDAAINKHASDVCFLFCTSRHDAFEFSKGVKSVIGESRYVGGFSNGSMDNKDLGYDGYQAVVGVLQSDSTTIDLFLQEGIAFNEYETGRQLAAQIKEGDYRKDSEVLLFFDAVNRDKGYFQMNYATPLISGMEDVLPYWTNNVVGARLMGDMKFKPTYQWFEDRMVQNSAIGMLLNGALKMDICVMHGCTPASAYHTVTKSDESAILSVDDRPVLDFLDDIFGSELAGDYQKLKFFVTMGKNLGDKWGNFKSTDYVNRMCVGVDQKTQGLRMAEIDLVEGSEFQLMRRGFDMDIIYDQTTHLIDEVEAAGRKPIFAMYLNCAGRAAAYSESTAEDAYAIQQAIDDRFPLMGIYEAGELAKVNGVLQVLDWTGIFCLFSE